MKNLMLALSLSMAAMAFSVPAHAKNAACDATVVEKKLAGAAKESFLKKCEADAMAAAPVAAAPAATPAASAAAPMMGASCDAKAADKKLAGAAKNSFVKKCEKDMGGSSAQASCDMKAADKKLAGAAKNSFVKKCVSDAAK
jgi:hypothetical protein